MGNVGFHSSAAAEWALTELFQGSRMQWLGLLVLEAFPSINGSDSLWFCGSQESPGARLSCPTGNAPRGVPLLF